MKLTTLKPRLKAAPPSRIQVLSAKAGTVDRKRGSAGVRDRERIRKRDCGLCQACRRNNLPRLGTQVDHIVPLWQGGSDDDTNKELLCDPCHAEKTAREARERARG